MSQTGVGARRASIVGPEVVAALIGVVLWGSALIVPFFGGGGSAGGVAVATPTASTSVSVSPSVDAADLRAVRDANGILLDRGLAIEALLRDTPVDAVALAAALGEVQVQVQVSMDALRPLSGSASTTRLAADIFAVYRSIQGRLAATLGLTTRDLTGWASGAAEVAADIRTLAAFGPRIAALLESGSDPGRAATSPSPAGSPPGSTPPSASPSPSPSPSPGASASPSPAPSASVVNVLADPGFAAPQLADWSLQVEAPAKATMTSDPDGHLDPGAAVVTISAGSDARSAIAITQSGIGIVAGQRYVATFTARSYAQREVRLRIASSDGTTYAVGIYTTGRDWQTFTLSFQALVSDPGAVFRLELGRSVVSVVIDRAGFGQTS